MKASLLQRLIPRVFRLRRLKSQIINYFEEAGIDKFSTEEIQVIEFLKKNDLSVFPYPFTKQYQPEQIEIHKDTTLNLYYTIWNGRRLYYKNAKNKNSARKYFNSLRLEQDPNSPHCYLSGDFNVANGAVLADIGAAEGNFSLSVIERVSRVYIFEPNPEWIRALKATFAQWSDKVTLVEKFVNDKSTTDSVCLDDYFKELNPPDFIKADIEGAEINFLKGAQQTLERTKAVQMAVCTYHNQNDANQIYGILSEFGFDCKFSEGFMLYYYGRENVVTPPYLRRGVVRATKIR